MTVKKLMEHYHAVALAAYGPLPVICRCGNLVMSFEMYVGCVHHKNENNQDNRPENLEIMHHGCHQRHHATGRTHSTEVIENQRIRMTGTKQSPETIAKRTAKLVGHKTSIETRKKIGDANKGKKRSPELRIRLSNALKGRQVGAAMMKSICECGRIMGRGPMGMHTKYTGHTSEPYNE